MSQARLRVFAGPNGSGKSTLFNAFAQKYNAGAFLNADLFENELLTKGFIDLCDYNLNLTQHDLEQFYSTERAKSLIEKSIRDNHIISLTIQENMIVDLTRKLHSYEGAIVSAFLRHHLLKKKIDFCFETVMSHRSKIDEIAEARAFGYKTYLYFVCIDDPEVNISRVGNRVQKGGHHVSAEKIESRYFNTLENLILAIEASDKCYLFDNSGTEFQLIAKVDQGKIQLEVEPDLLPNWFINYVLIYYAA